MSALAPARLRPARPPRPAGPKPAQAPSRPALRLVSGRLVSGAPVVAAKVPFAVLIAAILGGGLLTLLMLHTLAAQDAFTVHDLQHRTAALADAEQQLELADQQASAPSNLAAHARALGMVPTGSLKFVHRGGRVVGVATAELPPRQIQAPAVPQPTPRASATPGAQVTPSAPSAATSRQQAPQKQAQKQGTAPKHPASPSPRATSRH
jgi:hypothetical protein